MQVVTSPEQADFILASGTEALGHGDNSPPEDISLDGVRQLLEQCAARGGIPMLVANPDVVTVSRGGLIPMPGTFAQWYGKLGGEVRMTAPAVHKLCKAVIASAASKPIALPMLSLLQAKGHALTCKVPCRCICWASQLQ